MTTTTLTRQQAIERIRDKLSEMVDDEHSICEVASRFQFFCRGFSQWSFDELKQRYDWIVKRRPDITREELEGLANIWQLARQEFHGVTLACDTQCKEHDTCRGWDEFDEQQLSHLLEEIAGQEVTVVPDASSPTEG